MKPYAEPVSMGELKEGEVYFSVQYFDDQMCLPVVESLVFLGRNLESDDQERVYFQDLKSYCAGIRYDTATEGDKSVFYAQQEKYLNHIFRFEAALNELLRCSLRQERSSL